MHKGAVKMLVYFKLCVAKYKWEDIIMNKIYKPGELAPQDGMYVKVDKSGSIINNAFEMKMGEKFPPTQRSDVSYKLL